MRPLACILLAAVTLLPHAARGVPPGRDPLDIPPFGDYALHPVYYDFFLDRYADPGDLPDLRAGRVRVQHFDAVDVTDFAWERGGSVNYTWWMQMQEMRFLLPLIASPREDDRAIARDWLRRWFREHMASGRSPYLWGEPMTWAYRAMVFVYYLRTEQRREAPDEEVVGILPGAILEHQRRLAEASFFDENNHGFIDALGLYETTRVFDDDAVRRLACERLLALATRSVSAQGFHREHSPAYHFVVLRWLDEIVAYFGAHPVPDRTTVEGLRAVSERMSAAAYFLQDHHGGIPQIGDSDSSTVFRFGSAYRMERAPRGAPARFDTDAGYAVFKGVARDRRYVVFRVPGGVIDMRAHTHVDALSVFYAVDGETVLGDGGKYSYGAGGRRAYFQSAWAHNTLMPPPAGPEPSTSPRRVEMPREAAAEDGRGWSARLTYGTFRTTRRVVIPKSARSLVVVDTLRAGTGTGGGTKLETARATALWNIGHAVQTVRPLRGDGEGTWAWRLTTRRGRRFDLSLRVVPADTSGTARARLARGEGAPILGWYSPVHGVARPAPVIVLELEGEALVEMRVDEVRRGIHRRR